MWWVLATLVVGLHEVLAGDQSGHSSLQRTATFVKGPLLTTRSGLPRPAVLGSRHGHARIMAEEQQHLWVLGLPSAQHAQAGIHASLKVLGGRMLYAMPDEHHLHWLVQLDEQALNKLMATHENLTAAFFPHSYKLSPAVDAVIDFHKSNLKHQSEPPRHVKPYLLNSATGKPTRVVLLALGSVQHPEQLAALNEQLQKLWRERWQGGCEVGLSLDYPLLEIELCVQNLEEAAGLLAAQPAITWLDLSSKVVLHDLYSIAAMQAPELLLSANATPPDVNGGRTSPFFPYWAAGLDGTNQIVGVMDSGLDLDSCYLWDPAGNDYLTGPRTLYVPEQPWVYENLDPRGFELGKVNMYLNNDHRKVIMYSWDPDNGDATDDKGGHGTHVTTSLAGAPYGMTDITSNPDHATGVVPNAKVAFHDIGKASLNGEYENLSVGSTRQLYGAMRNMRSLGARVISNSWGADDLEIGLNYTSARCIVMNAFSWQNDDTLLVFAAGNSGSRLALSDTSGSVVSPATCSSVLAVGAADNFVYRGVYDANFNLRQPDGQEVQLPADSFLPVKAKGLIIYKISGTVPRQLSDIPNWFPYLGFDSSPITLRGREVKAVLANPLDACQPLLPGSVPADQQVMVVVQRLSNLTCSLQTVLQNVMANPSVLGGILMYSDIDFISSELATNSTLPDVSQYNGRPFLGVVSSVAEAADTVRVVQAGLISITWDPLDPANPIGSPYENVATYSSFGSSRAFDPDRTDRYYRIKPDLIAPGTGILAGVSDGVFSAQMDQCATRSMFGTSMATPQASGAAVMAVQYFNQGFYPSGAASASDAFTPTNTLIKALLLAGTEAMTGLGGTTRAPMKPPPSQFQGFGRLSLSRSLPLTDDVSKGWRMQVINNASLSAINQQHTYEVQLGAAASPGNQYLSVVMVFNDWFVFPSATVSSVNDLDLVVTGPSGAGSRTTYYPNGLKRPDPVNNVEKVLIQPAAPGTYIITVTARFLSLDDFTGSPLIQRYSLVVLGPVTNTIASPFNPAFKGAAATPGPSSSNGPDSSSSGSSNSSTSSPVFTGPSRPPAKIVPGAPNTTAGGNSSIGARATGAGACLPEPGLVGVLFASLLSLAFVLL